MSHEEQTLPCGRVPQQWLELAADGAVEPPEPTEAAHLRECRHCRAELAAQRQRWKPVAAAAARPVRLPPGLVGRTLASIRAVRGSLGGQHAEIAEPDGLLRVAEPAVLVLARRLARSVTESLPGTRLLGLSGGVSRVQVRIAARYGSALGDAAERVRRDLARELEHTLSAAAPVVEVLVDDVLADDIPAGGH